MPCIETKVTVALSPNQEERIKARLGEAISLLPGKSEQWLMCTFEDHSRIWFAGTNDAPAAYVEVKVLGGPNPAAYERLTAAITGILGEELAIPAERVYIKYGETPNWGWNGGNF